MSNRVAVAEISLRPHIYITCRTLLHEEEATDEEPVTQVTSCTSKASELSTCRTLLHGEEATDEEVLIDDH
jgi:hypothetical protein